MFMVVVVQDAGCGWGLERHNLVVVNILFPIFVCGVSDFVVV